MIVTPPIEVYFKEVQDAAAAEMKAIPGPCPRDTANFKRFGALKAWSTTMAICGGVCERQKMSD